MTNYLSAAIISNDIVLLIVEPNAFVMAHYIVTFTYMVTSNPIRFPPLRVNYASCYSMSCFKSGEAGVMLAVYSADIYVWIELPDVAEDVIYIYWLDSYISLSDDIDNVGDGIGNS